jgi:hypothetical protein
MRFLKIVKLKIIAYNYLYNMYVPLKVIFRKNSFKMVIIAVFAMIIRSIKKDEMENNEYCSISFRWC